MRRGFAGAAFALMLLPLAAAAQPLPDGFVRLREVDPRIRQDIRYAGPFNFTGRPVPGYQAGECILLSPVAQALQRAQTALARDGFGLKVYDCYRPQRAVAAFAAWARSNGQDGGRPVFYPGLDKSRLFALGYIATRSRHSLGIAVDIGLVRGDEAELSTPTTAGACDGPFATRARESSLDLGTAFDCFSPKSATGYPGLDRVARQNRDRLVAALAREGFRNYAREWWHFEYDAMPRPARAFDFPVR